MYRATMQLKLNFKLDEFLEDTQGLTVYLLFLVPSLLSAFAVLLPLSYWWTHWSLQLALLLLAIMAPAKFFYGPVKCRVEAYFKRQRKLQRFRDQEAMDYCPVCGCNTGNRADLYQPHIDRHIESGPKKLRRRLVELVIYREPTFEDIGHWILLTAINCATVGGVVALNWYPLRVIAEMMRGNL